MNISELRTDYPRCERHDYPLGIGARCDMCETEATRGDAPPPGGFSLGQRPISSTDTPRVACFKIIRSSGDSGEYKGKGAVNRLAAKLIETFPDMPYEKARGTAATALKQYVAY